VKKEAKLSASEVTEVEEGRGHHHHHFL